MSAYFILRATVNDPELYREYAAATPETIAKFGGRFVVRGGAFDVLEGEWTAPRVVVIEFDSLQAARAWYSSGEYAPLKEMRRRAADADAILIEGHTP